MRPRFLPCLRPSISVVDLRADRPLTVASEWVVTQQPDFRLSIGFRFKVLAVDLNSPTPVLEGTIRDHLADGKDHVTFLAELHAPQRRWISISMPVAWTRIPWWRVALRRRHHAELPDSAHVLGFISSPSVFSSINFTVSSLARDSSGEFSDEESFHNDPSGEAYSAFDSVHRIARRHVVSHKVCSAHPLH